MGERAWVDGFLFPETYLGMPSYHDPRQRQAWTAAIGRDDWLVYRTTVGDEVIPGISVQVRLFELADHLCAAVRFEVMARCILSCRHTSPHIGVTEELNYQVGPVVADVVSWPIAVWPSTRPEVVPIRM